MICVLRLGHRYERDKRISTHLCLTSRAFNADKIVFDVKDERVKKSIDKVVELWGGDFKVEFCEDYKKFIKEFNGIKVHLTMYGINIDDCIEKIKNSYNNLDPNSRNLLIIVGGKKVPSDVYFLSDYNVAIGNQPHSEISALAIFLDRFFDKKELKKEFNGKIKILPQERGKKVIKRTKTDESDG
ncbi:MAG: tRNA (cytidine(56)-2'-O)-methyltransferase [Candidatus Altarchaeaceae archaeon]